MGKATPRGFCLPAPVTAHTLQGLQSCRLLGPRFDHRHAAGTERERAGNRPVFDDQSAPVLLVDFFQPTVPSGRGRHQRPTLAPVPTRWGIRRTALGALSAAAAVCDAALLHAVRPALGAPLRPHVSGAAQAARAALTAVAGSLLSALPRMLWAVWPDDPPRAAQRPVACAVRRPGPVDVTVTAGTAAERAAVRRLAPPGGFSVFARGAADDDVWQERPDRPCRFMGRVKAKTVSEVQEERPVAAAAQAAGVQQDAGLRRVGTAPHCRVRPHPFRVGRVATGKTDANGTPEVRGWVTHRLDRAAALVALA